MSRQSSLSIKPLQFPVEIDAIIPLYINKIENLEVCLCLFPDIDQLFFEHFSNLYSEVTSLVFKKSSKLVRLCKKRTENRRSTSDSF